MNFDEYCKSPLIFTIKDYEKLSIDELKLMLAKAENKLAWIKSYEFDRRISLVTNILNEKIKNLNDQIESVRLGAALIQAADIINEREIKKLNEENEKLENELQLAKTKIKELETVNQNLTFCINCNAGPGVICKTPFCVKNKQLL